MNRWLRLACVLLCLLGACADLPEGANPDGGVGGQDAASRGDASGIPPPGEAEFDAARADDGACFDGLDNNDDGAADCDDRSCRANLASCCVGVSDASCCTPGAPTALPVAECVGSFGACPAASAYQAFGARGPEVVDLGGGAFAWIPNGESATDSGAVRLTPVDARRGTVTVTARIASGSSEGIDDVESIGFGLVDAARDPTELSRVEPLVGVVVSRNRQRVMLQIAGESVAEDGLADIEEHSYTLQITPDGQVLLTIDSGARLSGRAELIGPTRLAAWGRTPEGAAQPPRLASLSFTQDACDMPAALTAGPVVVPAPMDPDPTWRIERLRLERPHVLRFDDGTGEREWMVLRADGAIHIATPGAGGYVDAFGVPVLAPVTAGWGEDGVDHPHLRFDSGQLELWFTGYDASGRGTIAVAKWDPALERFTNPIPVDGLSSDGVSSFEAASVFDVPGRRLAAVRVRDAAGERLALFDVPPSSPAYALETLRQPRPEDVAAFDRDGLDSPAVIHAGRVYRLYFAGRRGNRWSLGLLVSDDGVHWRAPSEESIAAAPGNGFDALARRDPAPLIVDGALRLFYAGSDGARTRIGVLDGHVPD